MIKNRLSAWANEIFNLSEKEIKKFKNKYDWSTFEFDEISAVVTYWYDFESFINDEGKREYFDENPILFMYWRECLEYLYQWKETIKNNEIHRKK